MNPGLRPKTPDERDFKTGALIDMPAISELPEEYSVTPFSIKDQITDGNEDFCASYAGTGMREPEEEVEMFAPFLFAAAKLESGDAPSSWGLELRDVAKALIKWGIPEVQDVPHETKILQSDKRRDFTYYPQALRELAKKHLSSSFFSVTGPNDHFDNVRSMIWKNKDLKQQVIFGTDFGWHLQEYYLTGIPKGSGHAMWVAGWTKEGALVVDSGGLRAGHNGIHIMARDTFNIAVEKYGAFMVTDIPRKSIENFTAPITVAVETEQEVIMEKQHIVITLLQKVVSLWQEIINKKAMPTNQKLYEAAVALLGTDASPADEAPDELGCAETVSTILRKVLPDFPVTVSTYTLNEILKHHSLFKEVHYAQGELIPAGTIIICATVPNKPFPGHTGIFSTNSDIMSNDSRTGQFRLNYTLATWVARWFTKGGYVIRFYQLIE